MDQAAMTQIVNIKSSIFGASLEPLLDTNCALAGFAGDSLTFCLFWLAIAPVTQHHGVEP